MYPRNRLAKQYPVNPPTHEKLAEAEDTGERFQVVRSQVGPHDVGTIVSAKDFGPGADPNRLMRMGVIRQLSDDELDAIAGGESIPAPTPMDDAPPNAVIEPGVEPVPAASPILSLPIGVESHPDKIDALPMGPAPIPAELARPRPPAAKVPPPPGAPEPIPGEMAAPMGDVPAPKKVK